MKKIPFFDSLKSKKFRHGGYATLMVVVVIAAVVVISLIMDQLSLKIDMTRKGVFTLSEQTNKVLDDLKTDVAITTIKYGGQEDSSMKEILRRYAMRSRKITLKTIDPDLDPQWSKRYAPRGGSLRDGSIVVATASRFKTIDPYNLRMIKSNIYDPNATPEVLSFSAEQLLTSALIYATAEKDTVVYVLQGHGEQNLSALGLATAIADENYQVGYINLISERALPPDADVLLVMGPNLDLSTEDAEKIRSFLETGGRALILLDIPSVPNSRPVTSELLKSFGIAMRNLLVVEGDTSMISLNNPLYLLPKLEYHPITEPLSKNNLSIFLPASQAIDILTSRKAYLTMEPLLSSSAKSWGKEKYQNLSSLDREEGDPSGPFTLAMAITEKSGDPAKRDGKLVVAASSIFLREEFTRTQPGNSEFFLNAMGWLGEKKLNISIRPKDLSSSRLRIDSNSSYILSGIAVILMPLFILGWGFVIWVRRRHL
jgi:ABC-2 type transport system permease protein